MKINTFLSIIIALIIILSGCSSNNSEKYEDTYFLFDTCVSVNIQGNSPDSTAGSIKSEFAELDNIFAAAYNPETDFTAVYDEASGKNKDYSSTVNDVLKKVSGLNEIYGSRVNISCGALTALWGISTENPSVPSDSEIKDALKKMTDTDYCGNDCTSFPDGVFFDFGAVAKGYACDKAKAVLDSKKNISSAIITTGSSTLLYGTKLDGSDFSAAVRNPDGGSSYLGVIKTKQCFISTSGGYERFFEADGKKYCHILDTQTGYPVETDLASVTVVCPFDGTDYGGLKSDFLSTLIYMDGTDKLESYLDADDFFVVAADVNGNIYTSKGMDFTLNEESGYRLG